MTQSTISSHNSMKTMSLISLTFLGLMLPAAASAAATKQLDAGQVVLRDRLSEFGLAKSAQCVLKHCDSLSDMIYMSERQMRECGKVPVKVAKLQFFVSQLQEEAQEKVRALETLQKAIEKVVRGSGAQPLISDLPLEKLAARMDDESERLENLKAFIPSIKQITSTAEDRTAKQNTPRMRR